MAMTKKQFLDKMEELVNEYKGNPKDCTSDKKRYKKKEWNEIKNLDLSSLAWTTCIFAKHKEALGDHSSNFIIGHVGVDTETIDTNLKDEGGNFIEYKLADYNYLIKLSDLNLASLG